MARDGTARGGSRAGSGRKSKALTEKIESGNPGGRKLKVMELPDTLELKGEDVPDSKDYLSAKQKNGSDLGADEVFKETWILKWVQKTCVNTARTGYSNRVLYSVVYGSSLLSSTLVRNLIP